MNETFTRPTKSCLEVRGDNVKSQNIAQHIWPLIRYVISIGIHENVWTKMSQVWTHTS